MPGKNTLNIILLCLCVINARSQEVLTGLTSNPLLREGIKEYLNPGIKGADTLILPFSDDFSGDRIFPDQKKWEDDYAFINNTYSDDQITTGIATLDALDNKGRLYDAASSSVFEADRLTSQPFNLQYTPPDNIWLTFMYQPGGLGDRPEEGDSLTLHFYAPNEDKWYSVWRSPGNGRTAFKTAAVRIDDTKFLGKGFRFRFISYASLSPNQNDPAMLGNADHWNLDYIQLGINRNQADTIPADVAFRKPFRSLIKTFEAMPWKQFRQIYLQEMGSSIPLQYRNNDLIVRNITRNFEIFDVYKNTASYSFSAGATNIAPQTTADFSAGLVYTYDSPGADSALFRIKSWLITDTFDPKNNDTVTYYQNFSNYFAFDDGSAEAGYGINGLGSRNAMVAYRFRSYSSDTLRAIRICFNDSYLNANIRTFDLKVWDNNNGVPGAVIFTQEEVSVKQGSDINGFHTYIIPVPVPVNGIFYVGWKQRSEVFMNAGVDLNTQHGGKQFYWLNGNWYLSQANGTLMIRPVVGSSLTTSINELRYGKENKSFFGPNPARESITIDEELLYGGAKGTVSILDIQGREQMSTQVEGPINISSLSNGVYIIILKINGRPAAFSKLVKIS
jgi:hypothetical protein